jgi:hypothetical protein
VATRELWLEDIVSKAPIAPTVVAALVSAIVPGLGEDGRTVRGTRFVVVDARSCRTILGDSPANMPVIASNVALGRVMFELLTGRRWHKAQASYSRHELMTTVHGESAGEAVADLCDGLLAGAVTVPAAGTRAESLANLYRVDLARRLDEIASSTRSMKVDHPEQSTGAFPAGMLAEALASPQDETTDPATPPPVPAPSKRIPPIAALIAACIAVFVVVLAGGLAIAGMAGLW